MLPLFDRNRRKSVPFVTLILIGMCIIEYVYQIRIGQDEMYIYRFSFIASRMHLPFESYRFITYAFLHGSIWHLLGNMLFLWIFGDNIEDKLGHLRYLEFYILGAIASALVQGGVNFINGSQHIPMIGASGAISAVIAAYLIMFPKAKIITLIFISLIPLPAWVFIGLWFILQFVMAFFNFGSSEGVAYFAHIGGFLFGLAFVLIPRRKRKKR